MACSGDASGLALLLLFFFLFLVWLFHVSRADTLRLDPTGYNVCKRAVEIRLSSGALFVCRLAQIEAGCSQVLLGLCLEPRGVGFRGET
ncbi:hypothetical protein L209DRAFT_9111 [Thermothelomyces heterothallicus CBS 203.75]